MKQSYIFKKNLFHHFSLDFRWTRTGAKENVCELDKLISFKGNIGFLYMIWDYLRNILIWNLVNHINIRFYFIQRTPPLRVENLLDDLKDGSKLVHLLEVLSGEKLPVEKGRILRRPHFLSNCNTAIEFLRSKKVNTQNFMRRILYYFWKLPKTTPMCIFMMFLISSDKTGEYQCKWHRGWTTISCFGFNMDNHSIFPGKKIVRLFHQVKKWVLFISSDMKSLHPYYFDFKDRREL